jgi:hypothetical protein
MPRKSRPGGKGNKAIHGSLIRQYSGQNSDANGKTPVKLDYNSGDAIRYSQRNDNGAKNYEDWRCLPTNRVWQ